MSNVQPNEYDLSGVGVHITYSTTGPTLAYTGPSAGSPLAPGGGTLHFSGTQITTQEVAIGTLVTVTIFRTIDTGATAFSVLIPAIELASTAAKQAFRTLGIWTSFKGPDSFPSTGDRELYTTVALSGTASVNQPHIVPLYAVPIHDAAASGDLALMKRLAAQAAAVQNPSADVVSAVTALKAAIAKAGG